MQIGLHTLFVYNELELHKILKNINLSLPPELQELDMCLKPPRIWGDYLTIFSVNFLLKGGNRDTHISLILYLRDDTILDLEERLVWEILPGNIHICYERRIWAEAHEIRFVLETPFEEIASRSLSLLKIMNSYQKVDESVFFEPQ